MHMPEDNPHHLRSVEDLHKEANGNRKLLRMGSFAALAIAIHNFPEGLATFAGALQYPKLGASIAVAIAIHNIPEGISVAVPIYYATGSRRKAFSLSFLSGLSEPLGAVIGYIFLRAFFTATAFSILFATVGGVMVYVSLDELFPAAREHGSGHMSVGGLIAGMAVMALSLFLFK
jgi:ZIP family zinc transporter